MAFSFLSFIDLTTALVFIVVFLLVWHWISTPGDQIPGPFALPFIGNLPMFFGMRQRSHIELLKLKEKYGDVFRVYVGPYKLIVISGYDNIHQAFVKHGLNFSHRPNWLPDIKSRAKTYGYGKYIYICILIGGGEEAGCRVLEIRYYNSNYYFILLLSDAGFTSRIFKLFVPYMYIFYPVLLT